MKKLFITEESFFEEVKDKEIVLMIDGDVHMNKGFNLVFTPVDWESIKIYPEIKKYGTKAYFKLNERHSYYTY